MIVSETNGFVFICMPKCASTSTEAILRPYADIMTGRRPDYKHMTFRKYERFLEPLIRSKLKNGDEMPEVVCLFREPVDWLHSWYRYRQRDSLQGSDEREARRARKPLEWLNNLYRPSRSATPQPGTANERSTHGMSFEEFARQYVSAHPSPPARIGRQVNMLKDKTGNIGKITLFRYENYDVFLDYMSAKVGKRLKPRVMNKSPSAAKDSVPDLPFLTAYLQEDYAVYNSIST